MHTDIIVALIAALGGLAGSAIGVYSSAKLTNFRIEQLEKKVDKHNSVIERTYLLEEKMKETERRLGKIEELT